VMCLKQLSVVVLHCSQCSAVEVWSVRGEIRFPDLCGGSVDAVFFC
jgi:hypothetical protein